MSERTGKKRAGLGIAGAALTVAAMSASLMITSRAISADADTPTDAKAAAPAAESVVDATRVAAGRDLFGTWGCTACHTLADAKSSGAVGPAFDGDTNLSQDFIVTRVTNGQGAMPAFGGQMTAKEISDIAYYLMHVKK